MKVAYVDTSVLAGIAFGEPVADIFARALRGIDRLISSNLLEAELRAVFCRENEPFQEEAIAGIDWIFPNRPLASESEAVLSVGHLRGADLWHVATALYVSPQPQSLIFATLDAQQGRITSALGFAKVRI